MVEKREQVFLSSTYLDLTEERQEVIQTLLEADCIPAGMEMFPASDDDRWTLICRVIEDSDYYIVVVGGRYGSVDADESLSYTEMEFDYAVEAGIPIMGFLHRDPGSIRADKTENNADSVAKLNAFREKVSQRMVKYWTAPQNLGGTVAKSLIQIRKTHPAEGWVRANNALTPEFEAEVASLRAQVAELTQQAAAASQLPAIKDLAGGNDPYCLGYNLRYRSKTAPRKISRASYLSDTTWDHLLSELGPLMLDEATESVLSDQLDRFAGHCFKLEPQPYPEDFKSGISVQAVSSAKHDIIVQFLSLGLIESSERRRAVNDSNSYWTLTRVGRDRMVGLRAFRQEALDAEEGCDDEHKGGT